MQRLGMSVFTLLDEKPALTAGDIEFQGGAETFLRGFFDMVTFHLFAYISLSIR